MSYKSYAQAGQFSSYYIDLPIKAEINEDLRAASDFIKQMEVSQKYREKWANSYLDALDKKSSVERQNRDDNFEFMRNNYKRIYEGEQREFEGRMGELQRDQAERAQKDAEPGILEQLGPLLKMGISAAAGMIADAQAAKTVQQQETAKLVYSSMDPKATQAFFKTKKLYQTADSQQRELLINNAIKSLSPRPDGKPWETKDIAMLLGATGELDQFGRQIALDTQLTSIHDQMAQAAQPGGELDPQRYASIEEQRVATKQYGLELIQGTSIIGGENNTSQQLYAIDSINKHVNSILGRSGNIHKAKALDAIQRRDTGLTSALSSEGALNRAPQEFHSRYGAGWSEPLVKALKGTPGVTAADVDDMIVAHRLARNLPKGALGYEINNLILYRDELRLEQQKEINRNNIQIEKNQGIAAIKTDQTIAKAETAAEASAIAREALGASENTYTTDYRKWLSNIATNPDAAMRFLNPPLEQKLGLDKQTIKNSVIAGFDSHLNTGAHEPWQKRAPILLDEAMEMFPSYYEAALRDNPGLSQTRVAAIAGKNLADTFINKGVIQVGNTPNSSGHNPAKPVWTSLDSGRLNLSDNKNGRVLFEQRVKAALENDPEAVSKIFFSMNSDGRLKTSYNVLKSTVALMEKNDGELTQGGLRSIFFNHNTVMLSKITGLPRSQVIERQAKSLFGDDFKLPETMVATEAEVAAATGQAKQLLKGMDTNASYEFLGAHRRVQNGESSGYQSSPYVRQPVEAIVGSDVKSQDIDEWRDGKHEDHNHYAFESTAHRDQAAAWVKSEYKRRWGNEYLLNRDELEINHHEDRQGSSYHGAQGGHRASDVPRHNFVYGEGETIGANRVNQLYSEWFRGAGQSQQLEPVVQPMTEHVPGELVTLEEEKKEENPIPDALENLLQLLGRKY